MIATDTLKGWRGILKEYRKQNASVLATPMVERAVDNFITQNRSTRIYFGLEGRPVPIYKLFITREYINACNFSLASQATSSDGMHLTGAKLWTFLVQLGEIYLHPNTVNGSGVPINRSVPDPADLAVGSVYLLGFTIPSSEHDNDA